MVNFSDDTEVLARTLYGEAVSPKASEDIAIKDATAIAHVVMNRLKRNPKLYGDSVRRVCTKSAVTKAGRRVFQFTCWSPKDDAKSYKRITTVESGDHWFDRCWEIAEAVIAGTVPDPTKGATHYFASYIKTPSWAANKTPCYTVGVHRYYNDIDGPAPDKTPVPAKKPKSKALKATAAAGAVGATCATGFGVVDAINQASPVFPVVTAFAQHQIVALALVGLAVVAVLIGLGVWLGKRKKD